MSDRSDPKEAPNMEMEESFEICKRLKTQEGVLLFHPMINMQNTIEELPPEEWFVIVHLANGEPRTLTNQKDYDDLVRYLEMPRLEWDDVDRIVRAIQEDPIAEKFVIQNDAFFGWEIAVQTQTGGGVKVRSVEGWERWKNR
jgi:hypothetical protein